MLQWFVYLDHQFRDDDMTIPAFGEMGVQLQMEKIAPVQMDRRFEFRWYGVEAARSMQQMQMQMAGINVIAKIPPQAIPGKQLDLSPVVSTWVENIFGSRLGALVFKDIKSQLTLQPEFENQLLQQGFPLAVHPLDDDPQHMQVHQQAMAQGDLSGSIREHMMRHQMQMQQKQQAAMVQQQQMLQPRQQGGGGPRQGALAGPPRGGQQPPGAVPRDQMAGPPRTRMAGGMR
jgi:hypothetical protein